MGQSLIIELPNVPIPTSPPNYNQFQQPGDTIHLASASKIDSTTLKAYQKDKKILEPIFSISLPRKRSADHESADNSLGNKHRDLF